MNEYDEQANEFCEKYGWKIKFSFQGYGYNPYWIPPTETYNWKCVCAKNDKEDKTKKSATFSFHTKQYKTPSAYDLLACLTTYVPSTLEEFKKTYYGGEVLPETQHRLLQKQFKACLKQKAQLERLIDSDEELEAFENIQ